MFIIDKTLNYTKGVIKGLSGAVGDRLLKLNAKGINIGGMTFPVASLNEFTLKTDKTLFIKNDKLCLAINNSLYTLNTITVTTEKNIAEGQQVSYIIQHGEQSTVLTNLEQQSTTLVHYPDVPLIITGINYSTGATNSISTICDAGQAYKIVSVSESRIEGELKTVGGELISGGELKEICVSEGYDLQNAPVPYEKTLPIHIDTYSGILNWPTQVGESDEVANTRISGMLNNYMSGINLVWGYSLNQSYTYIANNQDYQYVVNNMRNTGMYLHEASTGPISQQDVNALDNYLQIFPGTPFFVPTGGIDAITYKDIGSYSTPRNQISLLLPATEQAEFASALQPGKIYIIDLNILPLDHQILINKQKGDIDVRVEIDIFNYVSVYLKIYGPLEKYCMEKDIIDTRFSYTTPIITTDTRRTVHTITLQLIAEN